MGPELETQVFNQVQAQYSKIFERNVCVDTVDRYYVLMFTEKTLLLFIIDFESNACSTAFKFKLILIFQQLDYWI